MAELSYYLDLRSKSSDGRGSLKILISHRNTTSMWTLGIRLLKEEWNKEKETIVLHTDKVRLNNTRKEMMNRANIVISSLSSEGKLGTMKASDIRDAIASFYVGRPESDKSKFFVSFDEKVSEYSTATKDIYMSTYRKIITYLTNSEYHIDENDFRHNRDTKIASQERNKQLEKARHDYRVDSLTFDDINIPWLKKFDAWMESKGIAKNTRSIKMRNIRAVFNHAIDNEYTTVYPFRKYKIKNEDTVKRSLSVQELRELFNGQYYDSFNEAVQVFRLIFCLIGINMKDLFYLTNDNIDSRGYLTYRRSKTHKLYRIKLEPEAIQLIKSLAGKNWLIKLHDIRLRHTDATKWLNLKLKLIGATDIIDKKTYKSKFPGLSAYWARHSWATAAAQLDIPKETISAALGHSMGCRTTTIYIDFDARKVDIANRLVLDWVFYGKYTSWNQAMINLHTEMEQEKSNGKDKITIVG